MITVNEGSLLYPQKKKIHLSRMGSKPGLHWVSPVEIVKVKTPSEQMYSFTRGYKGYGNPKPIGSMYGIFTYIWL